MEGESGRGEGREGHRSTRARTFEWMKRKRTKRYVTPQQRLRQLEEELQKSHLTTAACQRLAEDVRRLAAALEKRSAQEEHDADNTRPGPPRTEKLAIAHACGSISSELEGLLIAHEQRMLAVDH